jgi:hypothetical protein
VLRAHRLAVGFYNEDPETGKIVRTDRFELDVDGELTVVDAAAGKARPSLILVNDDDLTYTKLRFDDKSLAFATSNLYRFDDALARSVIWLALCNEVVKSGKSLKELAADFPQLPQTLINVPNVDKMAAKTNAKVQAAVEREEKLLGDTGRVLLRPSGTEPLVRVMAEAETQQQADEVCDRLAKVVADELTL